MSTVSKKKIDKETSIIWANPLLKLPIPSIPPEQLELYTPHDTQLRVVREFRPLLAIEAMKQAEKQKILSIDIGGKKIEAALVQVRKGNIVGITQIDPMRSNHGVGYLDYLKQVSDKYSATQDLLVGIAFAGTTSGTHPNKGANVPFLHEDMRGNQFQDFAKLFPTALHIDGDNDAITGLVAGTVEAFKGASHIQRALYLVNGGGIGGAIWDKRTGNLIAAEPGHIPLISALNPEKVRKPCRQNIACEGNTCIENVAASGAGIEEIYRSIRHAPLLGERISNLYQKGDHVITRLYDNAARATATALLGLNYAYDRLIKSKMEPLSPSSTAIICHGGTFNVPGFGERMEQILEKHLGYKPYIIYTKDFTKQTSGNACLDGAAILAVTSQPAR